MITVKPTIHLGGTNADTLINAFLDARSAVNDAIERLKEAAPNARDYHTQGEFAIDAAMEDHRRRVNALNEVALELYMLAEHVTVNRPS